MLAVAKTPRTRIRIEGYIPERILVLLRDEFGKALTVKVTEPDEELVDFFDTARVKQYMKNRTPSKTLRIYREMKEWSQEQLGKRVGVPRSRICDFEKGRRSIICRKNAKRTTLLSHSAKVMSYS